MHPLTVHSGPCIYYLPVQEQKRPTARDLLQTPRAGVGMTDRGARWTPNVWEHKWGLLCWGLTSACFLNNLVPEWEQKTRQGSFLFLPIWDRTLQQILQFFSMSPTDKTSGDWTCEVMPWPYANQVKSWRLRNQHSSFDRDHHFLFSRRVRRNADLRNACKSLSRSQHKLVHEFQVLSKKLNEQNDKKWLENHVGRKAIEKNTKEFLQSFSFMG